MDVRCVLRKRSEDVSRNVQTIEKIPICLTDDIPLAAPAIPNIRHTYIHINWYGIISTTININGIPTGHKLLLNV